MINFYKLKTGKDFSKVMSKVLDAENHQGIELNQFHFKDDNIDFLKAYFKQILNSRIICKYNDKCGLFLMERFQVEKSTLGVNNQTIEDYFIQVVIKELKRSNLNNVERLFDEANKDLRDNFTSKDTYENYKTGFKKLKELINNDENFEHVKKTLYALVSSCAYPGLYANLNIVVIPSEEQGNAAVITIPPIHIAPFEFISSFYFCIYFDKNSKMYNLEWLGDAECSMIKSQDIGENLFVKLLREVVEDAQDENFLIRYIGSVEHMPEPQFRHFLRDGDEYDIRKLFKIDVKSELRERERDERIRRELKQAKEKKKQLPMIVKEEYVARVSMNYNTYSN
jgi:hypothetical protein